MSTGQKANNVISYETQTSWEDTYQIDADGLTNADRSNFFVEMKGSEQHNWVECLYTGSGALTTSEFNNFPIGSKIWATGITTPSVYLKTGASTWKSQAINT